MFPNLLNATQEYWRKLDALEARYQQGEISLQEVDAEVARLMRELGDERRRSLRSFKNMLQGWFRDQKEFVYGLLLVVVVAYGWVISTTQLS
ncbi:MULTISPECIES: hypothetical protein [unclassified Picosynechococcus]|uniref:hypothetical protein n=1 Tax=unclassified Picosynechococcus TaxID=3079910 RepID=UPI0004AA455B|nr:MULTISPECIES: hypothetical protein [unclassified Picosynechococcus]AMA10767.1 hypothetical protein AWQ23_15120 [Picosynechococcus sp. PCC 73109]ANV88964.1 hypothetical protein AWQ22_15275 [Picosynechococcus sp. PCC 7117]QCS51098.1 hypothetical protein FEK30_16440 [Picosynechococcus sp. PCC 11901]